MADLGTLVPVSPLNASDDTRYAFTDDLDTSTSFALADPPGDFATMDTVSWQVEYREQGRTDDTLTLEIRIINGATILAAADSGGTPAVVATNITNTTDTTSAVTAFAYVNTTADQATWNGASVELHQQYTKSKGGDACHIEVDYVAITGTYTAGAANTNVPLDAGSYALSGFDTTVTVDVSVSLDTGSYALTGYTAAIDVTVPVTLDVGSYALSGFDTTVTTDTVSALDAGSYTLNGLDISIGADVTSPLDAGSYALSGFDTDVSITTPVPLDAGSYALVGFDTTVSLTINAKWDQDSYRWYTDAGGEGANPLAAVNIDPSTLGTGDQARLRYLMQETNGSNQSETPVVKLQYRVDAAGGTSFGAWTDLVDDTYFRAISSSSVTDGAATTQQIGAGTFRDGEFVWTKGGDFSPDDNADIVRWFDGRDSSGTKTTVSGKVSQWDDVVSGGTVYVEQTVDADRPANSTNYLTAVGSPSGDYLEIPSGNIFNTLDKHIFALVRPTQLVASSGYIFGTTAGNAQYGSGALGTFRAVGAPTLWNNDLQAVNEWVVDEWAVYEFVLLSGGNTSKLIKNGTLKDSTTATESTGTDIQRLLASNLSGARSLNGDLAQLLVFDGEQTGTDLTNIRDWLDARKVELPV